MKKLLFILALSFLAIAALTGCVKEDEKEPASRPESFANLVKAYRDGEVIDVIAAAPDKVDVTFMSGKTVEVPDSDFRIYDCRIYGPLEVSLSGDRWTVGRTVVDAPYTPQADAYDSWPVYVYFDELTLHILAGNGEVIDFPSRAAEIARMQNIPVIRIETAGHAPILDKENYVSGTITVSDPGGLYSDETEFSAQMRIRGRGNSTWSFPKKPWKIKLDKKASILGLPEDREWCLLANYADRTLMRNAVAMRLSEICGFSWTPGMRHVEVYLNGAYQGVYTFSEHKKVSKSRVDIDVAGPDDIDGGYYLEIEQSQDETVCWWTSMGVPMMFSDPELPTEAQQDYVRALFDDFEYVLHSPDFADPSKGYAAYIDVDSFINYYIVQELTKNVDGNLRKSSFLTKERGGKLEMYHVWDFDLTLGNCGFFPYEIGNGPEGFWIRDYDSFSYPGENWFSLMMRDPAFVSRLKEKWNSVRPELERIPDFIDGQALSLEKAAARNWEAWSIYESVDWVKFPSLGSYDKEVDFLKDFYKKRLQWLDVQINKMK